MAHHLDGNTHAINRHLADLESEVGFEEGQTCGRYSEPDEDAPRGYRPKPCQGVMVIEPTENCACHINPPCAACTNNVPVCDTCGEEAEA